MEQTKKENRLFLLVLYYLMFAALGWLYVFYVFPVFEDMGYDLDVNRCRIIASLCVLTGFVLITPTRVSARSFFLNLAITIQLVPSLVLFSLGGRPLESAMLVWMALLVACVVSAIPVPQIRVSSLDPKRLMLALAVATGILMLFYIAKGGLRNFNLDPRLVYVFRQDIADSLPGIFGYLTPIFSKIVIPFGFVVSLYYRKYILAGVFICFAVLMFGFTSHKGIVAYLVMATGIFYALSVYRGFLLVLIGVLAMLAIGYVDAYFFLEASGETNWGWFASIFIRRSLMVPQLLDYFYLEFFLNNPKYWWSTSRLTFGLVENPYDLLSPFLIGREYFRSDAAAANTGYIGSGAAQAGVFGIVLYSCGVGVVLAILNSFGRKLGLPFVAAVVSGQVATMISSTDFITLFLTHGMLVSIVLLALVNAPGEAKGKRLLPHGGAPLPARS